MKKIVLSAAIVAAAGLASCTAQAPKANLKSEIDSLSYMMGISNTFGLQDFAETRLGVDSAYYADFIKGIQEGINKTTKNERAFTAGVQIGQQLSGDIYENINKQLFSGSDESINKNNFLAGFFEALMHKTNITAEEAKEYIQPRTESIKAKAMEKKYAENKVAGEKFLEENKTKEGVQTTESGLQYKIIKAGKGEIPTKESTVKVNYKGTLIDGTEFDSSYKRNAPSTFRADQVIKGWTEALTMMPVGSKWELYIPQELAYGSRDTGGQIKPYSTLIFEVELVEIEKKK